MSKPKIYNYEGRTFEVTVRRENFRLIFIYIDEVIRPKRKFFGRTRFFASDYKPIGAYSTIDKAIEEVISHGIWYEQYQKFIDNRWKKWNES